MRGYNRRNMDDPIVLDALKTIESLKQIAINHSNYLEDYKHIKETYSKRLITTSKKGATYGMFMPETPLFWYMKDNFTSKITKNENAKEYAYYFDSNDQMIMAEKFSSKKGRLFCIYLYYYYNDYTDIIVYDAKNLKIDYIRRIEYNNDKAIRYFNFHQFGSDHLDTYHFYDDKIIVRNMFFWGKDMQEMSYEIPKQTIEDTACHEEKKEIVNFDIKNDIKELIGKSIKELDDEDIYAFSLYVEDDGDETKPTVTFGYNTIRQYENSIESADDKTEAKWNYAFWLQNELFVYGKDQSAQVVENWIEKKKLLDEDDDCEDDDTPKVTKAFVKELIKIVKELHKEKVLTAKFGKELPILIHELEYYEQIAEQNIKANGKKLLGDFLEFCPLE